MHSYAEMEQDNGLQKENIENVEKTLYEITSLFKRFGTIVT